MSLAPRVPLMKPGSTVRNVVVALGYIFLSFIWIPLAIAALPFVAAYKVYDGSWSAKLSKLPGIEPGGGVVPAIAAFAYVFVALGVVGAAMSGGGGGDAQTDATAALDGTPTADARATASATQEAAQTDGGNDATATESPKPTATATAKPTVSPSPTERQVMSDSEARATFKTNLQYHVDSRNDVDLTIESVEATGDRWLLSYSSYAQTQEEHASNIAMIAGGYAGFISRDDVDAPEGMDVDVYYPDGTKLGTWRVETEWAVAYNNGQISDEEYLSRVLGTLEAEE